jgi:hypothetical protein
LNVRIYATAYVKADTIEKALEMAKHLPASQLEFEEMSGGDIDISGRAFDDDALPDMSLSPSMTIDGIDEGSIEEVS